MEQEDKIIMITEKYLKAIDEIVGLKNENNRLFESLELERMNMKCLQKQLNIDIDFSNSKFIEFGRVKEQNSNLEKENRELRDKIRQLENKLQVDLTERTTKSNYKKRIDTGCEVANES